MRQWAHLVPVVGVGVKVGSSKMGCQQWVSTRPAAKSDGIAASDAGLCAAEQPCVTSAQSAAERLPSLLSMLNLCTYSTNFVCQAGAFKQIAAL